MDSTRRQARGAARAIGTRAALAWSAPDADERRVCRAAGGRRTRCGRQSGTFASHGSTAVVWLKRPLPPGVLMNVPVQVAA